MLGESENQIFLTRAAPNERGPKRRLPINLLFASFLSFTLAPSPQALGEVLVPAGYVVETYYPDVPAGKDLGFDSKGNLYVAHDEASPCYKIAPGATSRTSFGPSLSDPDSLVVDASDNVYIGSENQGLYIVAPDGASRRVTTDYMGNIYSLCIDRSGLFGSPRDVFVGNARSTYDIVRVNSSGQASPFVANSVLYTFPSMAFDDVGFLYATEDTAGKIYRISFSGSVAEFVALSGSCSITFNRAERFFYVGNTSSSQIYKLFLDGTLSVFARQVSPHGLTIGPDSCLYATDWSTTPDRVIRFRKTCLVRQITDRAGGGGPCASCCGIDHRQPILSPDGDRFVFSSTWNADDFIGNLNPERNRELFYFLVSSNKFQQLTATTNGMALPYALQGSTVAFLSCSPDYGANTDTNMDIFGYDSSTQTVTQWLNTVGPTPIQLGTNCPYAWFAASDWTALPNLHPDLAASQRHLVWASTRNIPSTGAPGGNNPDGNYEVYWKDLLTAEVRQLTSTVGGDNVSAAAAANLWPRTSADGSRVAFVSNRDFGGPPISSNRYGLFLAASDGSIHRLTDAEIQVAREFPAFAMDAAGTRVVFASDADLIGLNTNHTCQIFALDLNSSNVTQITRTGLGVTNSRPILSGDGRKIAFVSNADFGTSNADGSEELWGCNSDAGLTCSAAFIQVTSLASNPLATEGRISWLDWYSLDYTGSNLVFTCNTDLVGSNTVHAYEVFLATFAWQPFKCSIALAGTNQYALSWPTLCNASYTVESCTSLLDPVWLPVEPTNQWPTSSTSWTNSINLAEPARFFRVRAN